MALVVGPFLAKAATVTASSLFARAAGSEKDNAQAATRARVRRVRRCFNEKTSLQW